MEEQLNKKTSMLKVLGEIKEPGRTESVPALIEFVGSKAKEHGFSEQRVQEIGAALQEALTNIITHAYARIEGDITITCGVDQGENLVIEIVDKGEGFNMLLTDLAFFDSIDVDERKKVSNRTVKRMIDSIEYKRLDKSNVLTLITSHVARGA